MRPPPLDDPALKDAPDSTPIGDGRTLGEARRLSAGAAYAFGLTNRRPGWDYFAAVAFLPALWLVGHLFGWWS